MLGAIDPKTQPYYPYAVDIVNKLDQMANAAGGGNSLMMLATQPGPWLNLLHLAYAKVMTSYGDTQASYFKSHVAHSAQSRTNIPYQQWIVTWTPYFNTDVRVSASAVANPLIAACVASGGTWDPTTGSCFQTIAETGGEGTLPTGGSSVAWWVWVAGAALVGGVGYVVAKKKGWL